MVVIALALMLCGSAIRFHNLGGDSLWFDEVLTANAARSGLDGAFAARDHPPLLYLITWPFLRALGDNEFALRLPQALAGILAIPLLAQLGRSLGRQRAGLWAAFLLALSPFHLRYSQEARHYALLMTFSLATYLLLVQALAGGQFRQWLLFALATALNLYTHYGAFLVLAAELVLVGAWLARRLQARQFRLAARPALAGLFLLALYAPWLARLVTAVGSNLGEAAGPGTTGITPLNVWLRQAFLAFGFNHSVLATLLVILAAAGLALLAWQREWRGASLIVSLLTIPFVAIGLFQVARWGFPKYVIYMLPLYLLAAGVALDGLLLALARPDPRQTRLYAAGTAVVIVLFMLTIWPRLQEEYRYVEREWRGAAAYLDGRAAEGDIFLVMTLDLPDGFNEGGVALPYYLESSFERYTTLDANRLRLEQLQALAGTEATVWAIVLDRVTPVTPAGPAMHVEPVDGALFVIHPVRPAGPPLAQLVALYEQIAPLAVTPSPQCLLRQDQATLQAAMGDFVAAAGALAQAQEQCPIPATGEEARRALQQAIDRGLLAHHLAAGNEAAARQVARRLLQVDAKDEAALAALTVENLLQRFLAGQAQVQDEASPEPIQVRRFVMPHNGDWGEVLFVHPPAAVSFTITLPAEPAALRFRLALAPESWTWGGDGSTFVVRVAAATGPLAGGPATELFRKHVGNGPGDHDWQEGQVDLAAYAGQSITLTLATEAGPAGDSTGDWAGWETPRIVWR